MSRRLRRDTHKRISSAGYQRIAGDLEVTGNITGPSITDIFSALQVVACSTQTPVQLTVTRCEGAYKAIILQWQMQYNLATFSHYEVQVSDDDSTWYSLEFDGSDWKDVLDADTDVQAPLIVHVPIPFGGTTEAPTAVTLYYRVRQKTITGTTGTWSSSASATTSLVQTGDVAANAITATKILAGAVTVGKIFAGTLQALFARITGSLIIGRTHAGTPGEGDKECYIDDDELIFREYVSSAWKNRGRIGASVSASHMIVASSTFDANSGMADKFCDGTADQVQIQAAIDAVYADYGGGVVELTEGTFVLSAPIYPKSNIVFQCRGWKTIIKKNGNFHGIFINGSSGSEIENVQLRDFKIIKDNADTNAKDLIHADYAVNLIIENVWCYKPENRGAHLTYCENPVIQKCVFSNSISSDGLRIAASPTNPVMAKVISCMSRNNNGHGFNLSSIQYSIISNNTARDNTYTGFNLYNLDYCTVVGNVSKDNSQRGIYLEPSTSLRTLVSSNLCEGNAHGITIGAASNWITVTGNIAIGNLSNQFLDYGTDTQQSGNSWQQPVTGEPSLGTGHWRGDSAGGAAILNQNPTVAGTWYTVTFSNAPTGAKTAWAFAYVNRVTASTRQFLIRKYGDTNAGGNELIQISTANINIVGALGRFPLDSSKRAQIACNVAGQIVVYEAVFYDI